MQSYNKNILKEKGCYHDISTPTICITSTLIPCSDLYDETQGQVQSWVTLTYFSRSQRLIKEKVYHHDISTLLFVLEPTSILIPEINMMKLKVKFKDR